MPTDHRRRTSEEIRLMHVLVDTNVLLDLLLQRDPWHQDAEALFEAHLRGDWELYFTATTLTDVFYIARRDVCCGRSSRSRSSARISFRERTLLKFCGSVLRSVCWRSR